MVVTHYIAHNVAVGAAVGDERRRHFHPDHCRDGLRSTHRFGSFAAASERRRGCCECWVYLAKCTNVRKHGAEHFGVSRRYGCSAASVELS